MLKKTDERNRKSEDKLTLDLLSKDWNCVQEELAKGNIVVARSKNDFLYILDEGGDYVLFSHTAGSPGGGRKTFPKNEKYTAVIRNFFEISDSRFLVEYDKTMDLFGVLASAEEGILTMYPGEDRDADESVEFIVPESKNENMEVS
jgi:hypothetical protein